MPASEFAWGGEARMPIFQMYGTKRKASTEEGPGWGPDEMHPDEPNAAKRACPCYQDVDDEMCTDGEQQQMENNNSLILQPQQLQQQQHTIPQQNNIVWPQQQQVSPPRNSPLQQLPQATQDDSNLSSQQVPACGDTLASSRSETDEALMAMDSDCTPNLEQYRPAESVPLIRSDSCHEYCGTGDLSSTSSCIRCYCKPSWEGMMAMRPYISDIY